MVRLFMLYAILIFAKRAPKMINELLKIKGDGVGLKGLNIKNKMGEAALVGDKVKKGMMGVEGGIKKGAGALKQKLTGDLKSVGKDLKNGLKNGFTEKDPTTGRMKGLKGALEGAKKAGKNSIWGSKDKIKDSLKDTGKKVGAVGLQGFKDYKDAKDTKGAHLKGRMEIDPTHQTMKQKIESGLAHAISKANKGAGLFSDKEKANIQKRDLLGMLTGNPDVDKKKVTPQSMYDSFLPTGPDGKLLKPAGLSDEDFSKLKDGIQISKGSDGKYHIDSISDGAWSAFQKTDLYTQKLNDEGRFTAEGIRLDAKSADLNTIHQGQEQIAALSNSIASLETNLRANIGENMEKLNTKLGTSFSNIDQAFTEMENRQKKMQNAQEELVNARNSGADEATIAGLVSAFNEAQASYDQVKSEHQDIVQIQSMRDQRQQWQTEVDAKINIGYEYKDATTGESHEVNATNVDNAITATNADISKNNNLLSKAKEASNPKPASDGK